MVETTELKSPALNPKNVEAKKYYTFNETGNIMLSSTADTTVPIQESVQKIFAEVAVFFAGMTKAISTTPSGRKDKRGKDINYSIYNYQALERVIDGSGLFVHVNEEDVLYSSNKFGADFSKDLVESLLGLATGAGEMAFASAMVASIGKEGLKIGASSSTTDSRVGNIVFVCEHLLGMPIISAIVVYAHYHKVMQKVSIGPCFSESSVQIDWELHKDTYLFVPPSIIHEYAGDLDSIENDAKYQQLINWLKGLVKPRSGALQNILITSAGQNYTSAPNVKIAAPPAGGTQAVAKSVITNGGVTSIQIVNPGSGYKKAPAISFTGGGGGSGATATASI